MQLSAPVAAFHPVPDYAAAVLRVQLRQAEDDSVVAVGGRSIFLGHGGKTPRVFVLLHGFTDAPKQFEALGTRFFEAGDNVYIPRLPHHAERGGRVRALGRVTAGELAAFGDSTVDIARGLGDTVIVVGLSAGVNIAASVAQHRSDVHRTVLIAPAIAAGRVGTMSRADWSRSGRDCRTSHGATLPTRRARTSFRASAPAVSPKCCDSASLSAPRPSALRRLRDRSPSCSIKMTGR